MEILINDVLVEKSYSDSISCMGNEINDEMLVENTECQHSMTYN